jgi:aminomethyltransferase
MTDAASHTASASALKTTPLHALHAELGARLVPFAGYEMPLNYAAGIVKEHSHVRTKAGLFDVSHMGLAALSGPDHETTARALETLTPVDALSLKPGQQRYTQLLADDGGILDDLMVSRPPTEDEAGYLYLVVNASTKEADFAHIASRLPNGVTLERADNRALLALQGPAAAAVMTRLGADVSSLPFMMTAWGELAGIRCHWSRSGYTGEDGFEISCRDSDAPALWQALTADADVLPIGLGARDTLRLEAGLCLYGQDIDASTSPAEASLGFSIGKRRRAEGGFPGFERLKREWNGGLNRVRVGLTLDGRQAARTGMRILHDGNAVGHVTSGAFTPTAASSIAMGYVPPALAAPGTQLAVEIRGTSVAARVAALPFVPRRYFKAPKPA